jgi:Transposase DDE domain
VGGDRLPRGDRRSRREARIQVSRWARGVFLTVLHRLFVSGSDRAADRWREDYTIAGVEGLLPASSLSGDGVVGRGAAGTGAGWPHAVCAALPEGRGVVTCSRGSTWCSWIPPASTSLGRQGYSKDHRPDLRQMILAVLIDGDGRPVCSEMWPGNTAEVTTLIPVIDRLRRRFDIARACVVADRGMISAETMAKLEARRFLYLLGVRERTDKLVRELVLADPAPVAPLVMSKRPRRSTTRSRR